MPQHRQQPSRAQPRVIHRLNDGFNPAVPAAQRSLLCVLLAGLASLFLALAPASPAHAETCPNEQLRVEDHSTALPDCRAYEQVSPPFKYGQEMKFLPADGIASDGEALSFNSLGAFGEPGNEDGESGVFLIDRRGASGWVSTAVNLSREQFQGLGPPNEGEVSDFSIDLGESLAIQAPVSATAVDMRIYRVPLGGEPVEVGPTIEPAKAAAYSAQDVEDVNQPTQVYAGAGANLEHVFFELDNSQLVGDTYGDWFWGGDTTTPARHSLYEYTGTGDSEPELVGVRGGLGSRELIGQCGTNIGDPQSDYAQSDDSYNAISESGDTVFFTVAACGGSPAVNELYGRVDRSGTVAISEPRLPGGGLGECVAGEPCDGAAAEPGVFQGANQAGTVVFFLSEQPLVDGAPTAGVKLYEERLEGEGVAARVAEVVDVSNQGASAGVQTGVLGVARVAQDGTRVYFVAEGVLAKNRDALGEEAHQGAKNLYVYDTSSRRLVFVAALSPDDVADWQVLDARPVDASADGRFLVFLSGANLTPGSDSEGRQQVYLYDAQRGEEEAQAAVASAKSLVRVSIGQQSPDGYYCPSTKRIESGYNCDGNPGGGVAIPERNFEKTSYAHPLATAVSEEGGTVFFTSTGALTPQATNEAVVGCTIEEGGSCVKPSIASNVYEYEDGQVYLLAAGSAHAELFGADPSGENVFFTTSEPLVAQDTDTGQDLYDARVDGGFPAPAVPAECKGETCQAPVGPAPALGAPASAVFAGPGNLLAPVAVTPKPKAKPLTRAQKLARALKACRREKSKRSRASCEKTAKARYGPKLRAKKTDRRVHS